ncbi:MAG: hypothetical protein ACE5FG_11120 [Myxococcota bacterium]
MRAETRLALPALLLALMLGLPAGPARAQQVFSGDPQDPVTGQALPMLPGLPLLLPGPDDEFGTGDDVIDPNHSGDVDLVVRVGTHPAGSIPPPAGASGGPSVTTISAGGGVIDPAQEIPFTVLVSDGSGSPPYGQVLTSADLDGRPFTIFAFADLDDDGVIGPTDADGSADDALELQEATAYVGRQVGLLQAGRLQDSLGFHVAAPASLGGLRVVLVAGGYTGSDPNALFSDGPPIFTLWPYFPPLDPGRVIGNGRVPPPVPDAPSEIKFSPERNYLPAPGHPQLDTPFAIPTDGTEPSTDQLVVVSGAAIAARLFDEVSPTSFRATSRTWLRPAPGAGGRVLVLPAGALLDLPADGAASTRSLRLLPVDRLGNVADPAPGGFAVELAAHGGVRIVSPDGDGDPLVESLVLASAAGTVVVLDDSGTMGEGRLDLLQGARLIGSSRVAIGQPDLDQDGTAQDGNLSLLLADFACQAGDRIAAVPCDDNCPLLANPSQDDHDRNGLGGCCDGTCVVDPLRAGCSSCGSQTAVPSLPAPALLLLAAALVIGGGRRLHARRP